MVRRLKKDVLQELPAKTRTKITLLKEDLDKVSVKEINKLKKESGSGQDFGMGENPDA